MTADSVGDDWKNWAQRHKSTLKVISLVFLYAIFSFNLKAALVCISKKKYQDKKNYRVSKDHLKSNHKKCKYKIDRTKSH